jgi:putative ABC transport system permease protein
MAAGLLVVAAATAATREARLRDVVVLRALGAPASALRRAALVEFAAVGLVAGLLAALVGALSSAAVAILLLDVSWTPAPGAIAATVVAGVAAAAAAGWAGTASVLRASPAGALRASP